MKLHLIKGDSFKILQKLEGESIDLILTDPPYTASKSRHLFWKEKSYKKINIDWDKIDDIDSFNKEWILKLEPLLKDGGVVYVTCSLHNISSLLKIFENTKLRLRNIITWFKPNAMPTQRAYLGYFAYSCEYILFYSRGKINTWNYKWMKKLNNEKQQRDLLTFNVLTEEKWGHPTQKPELLWKYLIQTCTKENDIILDIFLGSGTTMKCARDLNRNCIGIEINPSYIERIKKRLNWESSLDNSIEWIYEEVE